MSVKKVKINHSLTLYGDDIKFINDRFIIDVKRVYEKVQYNDTILLYTQGNGIYQYDGNRTVKFLFLSKLIIPTEEHYHDFKSRMLISRDLLYITQGLILQVYSLTTNEFLMEINISLPRPPHRRAHTRREIRSSCIFNGFFTTYSSDGIITVWEIDLKYQRIHFKTIDCLTEMDRTILSWETSTADFLVVSGSYSLALYTMSDQDSGVTLNKMHEIQILDGVGSCLHVQDKTLYISTYYHHRLIMCRDAIIEKIIDINYPIYKLVKCDDILYFVSKYGLMGVDIYGEVQCVNKHTQRVLYKDEFIHMDIYKVNERVVTIGSNKIIGWTDPRIWTRVKHKFFGDDIRSRVSELIKLNLIKKKCILSVLPRDILFVICEMVATNPH
jgi:hypothetical protein